MSDHHTSPDPMDQAYAQAEALLSDEAARAARRARVLAAVEAQPAAAPAEPAPVTRRPVMVRGGWLVAASLVAGLSVVLATQVYPPTTVERPPAPQQPPAPAASTVPAAAAPAPAAPAPESAPAAPARQSAPLPALLPAPIAQPAPAAPKAAPPAPAFAPQVTRPAARDLAEAAPPPPPPPPPPAPVRQASRAAVPAPMVAAAPSGEIQELVVTGEKRVSPNLQMPAAQLFAGSPDDRAERLRDAAAEGRIADLTALLDRRVPVDAADAAGETALMRAVQAGQPATAALLRRRGASLDLRNHAGVSAREMAATASDPALNRALGLPPPKVP